MLAIDPTKVWYIIVKAREFDVKVDPVGPHEGSDEVDDQNREILEDYPDDPTFQELRDAIDGLNEEEAYNLVALMWVGRGTFTTDEWGDAISEAAREATNATSEYLLGTPLLGDYLEEGMSQLGYSMDKETLAHL